MMLMTRRSSFEIVPNWRGWTDVQTQSPITHAITLPVPGSLVNRSPQRNNKESKDKDTAAGTAQQHHLRRTERTSAPKTQRTQFRSLFKVVERVILFNLNPSLIDFAFES